MAHRPLIIVDFGSQYTMLIARRVRELQIYCEVVPDTVHAQVINEKNPIGIILSGSPNSATEEGHRLDWLWQQTVPVLGICFGMQWLVRSLGGAVVGGGNSEFGATPICVAEHPLFADIPSTKFTAWMSHGDHVTQLPEDFQTIAHSQSCPIVACAHQTKPWFGLQFHPEVTHTEHGMRILTNFVMDICQAETNWRTETILHDMIEAIRTQVGDEKVLLALSGGVDSAVVAALLHKAIGSQLRCVFIDHGLLRQDEQVQVVHLFGDTFGVHLTVLNEQKRFMDALCGVTDPEEKRMRIGNAFIAAFNAHVDSLTETISWLAQGTIYPDVIESAAGSKKAAVIKSHHNVGGLPDDMPFALLEPIRMLFKDEVRTLGKALGLPNALLKRHPFPGTGLAVRILGEVTHTYADIVRRADAIFIDILKNTGWYDNLAQAFAVFLPVKTVGVAGDERVYEYVIALRAVTTTDFMTATAAPLPHAILTQVANQITNNIAEVARVTYDISSKPPATIEWE